jgi:amidohydrolase
MSLFQIFASRLLSTGLAAALAIPSGAATLEQQIAAIDSKVIAWRRDLHQNPELSNREFRTAKLVTEHLKKLGLKVETGIAKTGVVALLDSGRAGPTIALRADMDGLPVTEEANVPFKSQVKAEYRGATVGVMHACGHDSHTAILMGVAEALSKMKSELRGKVLFVFQPAEEGAPEGEEGGAPLMLKEGVFDRYKPEAAFALHVTSNMRAGQIGYRGGPLMAASDFYRIVVQGKQTHGARPWNGVDPIVVSAQIVNALQTVVSRQVDITKNPAVVTVGAIKGGVRHNIVPDSVEMLGTIRTFDPGQRQDIIERMRRTIEGTAAAAGGSAKFEVANDGNPVTYNNPELTERVVPSLRKAAGEANVRTIPLETGAEDFAFFAQKVPSFFFFVGVTPADQNPVAAPSNHSPLFYIDESAIPVATRALAQIAVDYLASGAGS